MFAVVGLKKNNSINKNGNKNSKLIENGQSITASEKCKIIKYDRGTMIRSLFPPTFGGLAVELC